MLPQLHTSRLTLRPIAVSDHDRLWRLLAAPEVRRYLCDDVLLMREQVMDLIVENLKLAPDGLGLWALKDHDGAWLGCLGLQPVPAATVALRPDLGGEVEPLIALRSQAQRQGYATEALVAACGYAFRKLHLNRMIALVDEPNLASHRLLRRVGFVPTGTCTGPSHILRLYRLEARACPEHRPGAG